MKERPIIFNTESVRAILEGRKTQTRRVIKPQPEGDRRIVQLYEKDWWGFSPIEDWQTTIDIRCPYGKPGDRLWVKEKHIIDVDRQCAILADGTEVFKTGEVIEKFCNTNSINFRSPRFMPRWASRITLEITDVRVERIQDIDEHDILAEGIIPPRCVGMFAEDEFLEIIHDSFITWWDSMNAKCGYGYENNPWVWVIEFKKVKQIREDNYEDGSTKV